MVIWHFNSLLIGGAAIAARRIHDSFVSRGFPSLFFYDPDSGNVDDSTYRPFKPVKNLSVSQKVRGLIRRHHLISIVARHTLNRPDGYDQFFPVWQPYTTPFPQHNHPPDIIHLHWFTGCVDYPSFFASVPDWLPIVWTLHDMNPFTGGCHYAWDCTSFQSHCCNCPQLAAASPHDLAHKNFRIRSRALRNKNLHIVAASRWLEFQARKSCLFKNAKSFRTIPYGIDTVKYRPLNKEACRQALGIPTEMFVVCFVAATLKDRRKGLNELLSALHHIADFKQTVCLLLGHMDASYKWPNSLNVMALGYIESPEKQSLIYSAADVFAIPSLQDNLPNTVMETMACGTPVVGFNIGGIPDMVHHMETGLLARGGDVDDLAHQIRWMVEHPEERMRMGQNARRLVEKEFTIRIQAERYMTLYQSLLKNNQT